LLAAQDEEKEERGKRAAEPRHTARAHPVEPSEPAYVEAGSHQQLAEHERVLRLFDDLVVRVAKLRLRHVERGRELEQPDLERALELEPELHLRRDQMQAEPGARRLRQRAIP